jgi:hypothetical protein
MRRSVLIDKRGDKTSSQPLPAASPLRRVKSEIPTSTRTAMTTTSRASQNELYSSGSFEPETTTRTKTNPHNRQQQQPASLDRDQASNSGGEGGQIEDLIDSLDEMVKDLEDDFSTADKKKSNNVKNANGATTAASDGKTTGSGSTSIDDANLATTQEASSSRSMLSSLQQSTQLRPDVARGPFWSIKSTMILVSPRATL